MGLVSEPQCVIKSSVSPRNSKCSGRSRIQSVPRLQRFEAKHNDFRPCIAKVKPSQHRPLCIPPNIPTRPVCELETKSPGNIHRRFHSELGNIPGIHIPPPICPDRSVPSTGSEPEGRTSSAGGTSLAQTWYPLLLELCVDFPLLLPMQTGLLTQQGRNHSLH